MLHDGNVEYIKDFSDAVKKAVLAFANSEGGTIYIGIDSQGVVTGLHQAAESLPRMLNSVRNSIRPDVTPVTEAFVERLQDKEIIVFQIRSGPWQPYYLAAKGMSPDGVYIRRNAHLACASLAEIAMLLSREDDIAYEARRSFRQDLTFKKLQSCCDSQNIVMDGPFFKQFGILGDDNLYTNLALLLSDQCERTIQVAAYKGNDTAACLSCSDHGSSILQQLDEAMQAINHCLDTQDGSYHEGNSPQMYPPAALREALLNAVLHRDYTLPANIFVHIFWNRVEIINPGGIVPGLEIQDVLLGLSSCRNPRLGRILQKLSLFGAFAAGVAVILSAYDECAAKPVFSTSPHAFKVMLPNQRRYPKVQPIMEKSDDERIQKVMQLFKKQHSIVRKDVEAATGMSQAAAVVLLRNLVLQGQIQKKGHGKLVTYVLS
jgi:ATP-dependent DNA helicase RecG